VSSLSEKKLPSLTLSLLPIVVPILLILIKALINLFPLADEGSNPMGFWFVQVFDFIGTPMIALCISTLLAVYMLVPGLDKQQTSARLEEGLQSAGIILLVTGAGGALGFVVRESGAGTLLAGQIADLPFSPVMIPFFVASVVRLIQGSATVAMITSASITAPILAEVPDVNMLFAAQAATIGAFLFSYFNDSLFWVVGKLIGISDVKVHITTWSVPTILGWAVGGILIALLNLFFGSRGSLLDLLVPVVGLGIVFWVMRKK
jgi:GntP family gluconate:H+ symporter